MISLPFLKIVVVLEELDEEISLLEEWLSVLVEVLSAGDKKCSVFDEEKSTSLDDDALFDEELLSVGEELADAPNTETELFFSDAEQPASKTAARPAANNLLFIINPPLTLVKSDKSDNRIVVKSLARFNRVIKRVPARADIALDCPYVRSVIVLGNHSYVAPVIFLGFLRPEIADKIAAFRDKFLARCVYNAVCILKSPFYKAVVILLP